MKEIPFIFSQGEEHYMAKLTDDQIREIRGYYERGYYQREIAEMFSICRQTVSRIISRKGWKHVK